MSEKVEVSFPREELREHCDALADVLCWIRGFIAACPDDLSRHPLGVEKVSDLHIKLKASFPKGENK